MMKVNITAHAIERSHGLFKIGNLKKYCSSMVVKAYDLINEDENEFSCVIRDYNKNISTFVEFSKNDKGPIATISTLGTLIKYPRDGECVVYCNEDKTFSVRKWSKEKHQLQMQKKKMLS